MKPILSQLGRLLFAAALCHAGLLVLSLALYPLAPVIDATRFRDTPYPNPFRAAVNGALENGFRQNDALIVIGPSNASAFRPEELSVRLPGVRAHNLSTPSMRVDEMGQLVRLAWEVMPVEQRQRARFVLTLIFASFPHPQSLYGKREAGIIGEIARSGELVQVDGDFAPRWNPGAMRAVALLRRPFALIDTAIDALTRSTFGIRSFATRAFYKGVVEPSLLAEPAPPDKSLFPRANNDRGRKTNLAFFQAYLAADDMKLGQGQFEELMRICNWADRQGVDLVLVGMPVPDWVREGLPFYDDYRRRLDPILDLVRNSTTLRFVDLHDSELPLWDATHADPAQTELWAAALATALNGKAPR